MGAAEISETAFEALQQTQTDPLFTTLTAYEAWRQEMGILRTFWTSGEERLALLGVEEEEGRLVAVARLLRVPFYERKQWGSQGEERGEVQDVITASHSAIQLGLLHPAGLRPPRGADRLAGR